MKIYTIGHKSPDLDCIAAAYEYADFLTKSKRYGDAQVIPLRAGEPNKETQFIFDKFGAKMPELIDNVTIEPKDAFVLVDHNETDQRSEKVVADQIIEIVDHHKANFSFKSPIRIDVKPLGSSSTLIYDLFESAGIEPSREVAGLVISAIISDTTGLQSVTTTETDRVLIKRIADKLGVDLQQLTFEVFKSKSDITGMLPEEIVKKDYKIFDFGGKKVFIGVIETVEPEKVIAQKADLLNAIEVVKQQEKADQVYFIVVDILKVNSQAIYATETEREVIEKAFKTTGTGGVANIGPLLSRKKEIAPAIEEVLTK